TPGRTGRIFLTLPPTRLAPRSANLRSGAFQGAFEYLPGRRPALRGQCQDAPGRTGRTATGLHDGSRLTMLSPTLNSRSSEIHAAAVKGDIRKVRALLDSNPSCVNARDEKGRTPLQCAANYDRRAAVELLLDCGADVNSREETGR